MSGKITAHFGADVSEVEAKMLQAVRATKRYEQAVKAIDGKKEIEGVTQRLDKANASMAKGMGLLKGGAVGMGISLVIGQMKSFADYAAQLGDKATAAQKSAATWGKEFESFGNSIKDAGASVLGTLAGWGRNIGDKFRDPIDKAYDDIAEASEKAADRQEAALEKMKAAHAKAAAEIPELVEKLGVEQRETDLSKLDAYTRALTEVQEIEKKIAEIKAKPVTSVNQAERLRLSIELEKADRKLHAESLKQVGEYIQKRDEATEKDKADIKEIAALFEAVDAKAAEVAKRREKEEAERLREIADMRYERAWRFATDEQKIAQVRKEGREAQAAYDKDASSENLVALEKARKKWLDLRDEINGAKKDATTAETGDEGGGRTRGADGKLRLRGAVVSEADAARSDNTRARNASLNRDAMRSRITDSGRIGNDAGSQLKRTEDLLTKIEGHLQPKAIK